MHSNLDIKKWLELTVIIKHDALCRSMTIKVSITPLIWFDQSFCCCCC